MCRVHYEQSVTGNEEAKDEEEEERERE